MTDTIDTDAIARMDRRAFVKEADTDANDVAHVLYSFDHVAYVEPLGMDDPMRETLISVLFDDEGWRDSEAVIDLCRCAGFEVNQVLFQRGEIRFEPEDA